LVLLRLGGEGIKAGGTQATKGSESLGCQDGRLDSNRAVLVDNTHYHEVLEEH
jgi:hypothetical protein